MIKIKLKKLLKEPAISSLINDFIESLVIKFNIRDSQENSLFGEVEEGLFQRYPVQVRDEIIGWVIGEKAVFIVAKFLSCLANQELEKKELAQKTLDKYDEINFLANISAKIASCNGFMQIIKLLVSEVQKLIETTEIAVILRDKETQQFTIIAFKGQNYEKKILHKSDLGIAGYVLQSGREEIINDVLLDSRFESNNTRSLICTPLTIQNETIGVITIGHEQPNYYTTDNLKLFSAITSQAAAAIQTAQYYEQIQEYSHSLEQKVAERTSALQQANQELHRLATVDDLTKVANRRQFDQKLQYYWQKFSIENYPLSLILCDVDYFKLYNDLYGHQMGDFCLHSIAQTMLKTIRSPKDIVARYGGEEFAVILPDIQLKAAEKIAERIRVAIESLNIPHDLSKVNRYVTVSLGVATIIPNLLISPDELVKSADKALYRAKLRGRNCVQLSE